MNLFLDIETLPTDRADVRAWLSNALQEELDAALAAVSAPANYKDADKIAAYCEERRATLQREHAQKWADKVASTGVDGSFGRVCVIGWAVNDGPALALHNAEERELLEAFAHDIHHAIPPSERHTTAFIGHNVQWDVRFLMQRYMVHGIRPPIVLHRAAQAKPWESEKLFDTMVQWAGVGQRVSLDKLCLALSIPSPKAGGVDGSHVAALVEAGRIADVVAYCRGDVEAAREVWRRMTFQHSRARELAQA